MASSPLLAAGRPSLGSHPRLVKTETARNGTETARNIKAGAVSGRFGAVSGSFGLFTFVNASSLRWPANEVRSMELPHLRLVSSYSGQRY